MTPQRKSRGCGRTRLKLVKTASYWSPFWPVVAVKRRWSPSRPPAGVKVVPPLVETSHCTVGVGDPVATAVKVAAKISSIVHARRIGGDGFCGVGPVRLREGGGRGGGRADRVGEDHWYWSPFLAVVVVNE